MIKVLLQSGFNIPQLAALGSRFLGFPVYFKAQNNNLYENGLVGI
jgi:hypothetical protein